MVGDSLHLLVALILLIDPGRSDPGEYQGILVAHPEQTHEIYEGHLSHPDGIDGYGQPWLVACQK